MKLPCIFAISFVFSAFFSFSHAHSSNLTFKFVNPAFAGGANAGAYLLDSARGRAIRPYGGRNSGGRGSQTPTYNIVVENGSVTLQIGEGNYATTHIQTGNDNHSTSEQNGN